jgi:hypothetical protein
MVLSPWSKAKNNSHYVDDSYMMIHSSALNGVWYVGEPGDRVGADPACNQLETGHHCPDFYTPGLS